MSVKVSITNTVPEGIEKVKQKVDVRTKEIISKMTFEVRNTAVNKIMREPKTGRVYTRGGISHQASAEGEAPASNTGFLVNNIYQKVDANGLTGTVESRASYSAFLEYGTQRMGARPFMFPSVEEVRVKFKKQFQGIVR